MSWTCEACGRTNAAAFCEGCGARRPGRSTADPTKGDEAEARRSRQTNAALGIGAALLGAATAAGVYFLFFAGHATSPPEPATSTTRPPLPTRAADAAVLERPSIELPTEWFRIVHFMRATREPTEATGAPDQRYAEIGSRGTLTLELRPGSIVATDGGPGPDIYLAVEPITSGSYQVEVSSSHDHFVPVVAQVTGAVPLDLDQCELPSVRYVRLSSAGSRSVFVDAVGAYHVAPALEHDHH